MIDIKKRILLFLLFVLIFGALFYTLKLEKDSKIAELLNEQSKYLELSYKQGLDRFNVIAHNVYLSLQNDKKFIDILAAAEESDLPDTNEKLYDHLKYEFDSLKNMGVMGLQVSLPNNVSAVRMHKKDKFGDDLSGIRYSLKYVNEKKVHVGGFEEGKTSHAFRELFPLYKEGKYIGALEVMFSSTILQDYTMRVSDIHTHFIVNKKVFKTNEWKSKLIEPYQESIEHRDFLFSQNDHMIHDRLEDSRTMLTIPLSFEIDEGIKTNKAFTLYKTVGSTAKIMAFLPVERVKDKKVVAYIVSYVESEKIVDILKNFNIMIGVIAFIFFVAYIVVCRLLGEKRQMENELQFDGLTNVYNRKYFINKLERNFASLKESDYSIVMADIDYFKSVNDDYGHQYGDTILVEFSKLFQENLRSLDMVARYGGEEFIMFLLTDEKHAFKVVENIREKIAAKEFGDKKLRVTSSFGIAQYKGDSSITEIISRADKALYMSKENGRNQTQIL